jgi:predicted dienelactone hydrolase
VQAKRQLRVAIALALLGAVGCGAAPMRSPGLSAPARSADAAVPPADAVAPPTHASVPAAVRPPVGVASRVFNDAARDRMLATTIWYPAAAGTVENEIEWDGIFVGHGAWHAALRTNAPRLPVVMLSHGSGGDGSNLAWLAEALASRGYLAVAVDHPGDRFGDTTVEGRFAAWRRVRDVSVVLDRLLTDATFGRHVDRTRVAAAGHSSGAYTALALVGVRLQPSAFFKYCSAPQPGPDCKLFVDLQPNRIADLAKAGKSRRDRRIRAVLALAPVLGPAAIPASLRSVTVPVTIVASPTDEYVPFEMNAKRYQRLIPRARLVTIPDAGHFVFMPMCTFPGRLVASQVCVDPSTAVDRQAIHTKVVELAIEFFDRRLGVRRVRRAGRHRPVPGR